MFNVNVKNATSEKLSDAYKVTRISVLCCISAVLEQMSNKSLFFKPKRPHHQESEGFCVVQFNSYFEKSRRSVTASFKVSKVEKAPTTFFCFQVCFFLSKIVVAPSSSSSSSSSLASIGVNQHQLSSIMRRC